MDFFKNIIITDNELPTGSPIPSSHSYIKSDKSNQSIKSSRKSSETLYIGNFGFRIVKERPSIINSPIDNKSKASNIADKSIMNSSEKIPENTELANIEGEDHINQSNLSNSMNNNSENNNNDQLSTALASAFQYSQNVSDSDSEDMIELGDFNKTPIQGKQKTKSPMLFSTPTQSPNIQNNENNNKFGIKKLAAIPTIETIGYKPNIQSGIFGRIVKQAAVTSLRKLAGQKELTNRIFANFFQAFDEWNMQKEKKERTKKEEVERKKKIDRQKDFISPEQSLSAQLQTAKEKIENLSQEAEKWMNKCNINEITPKVNNDNSNQNTSFTNFSQLSNISSFNDNYQKNNNNEDDFQPIKINIDYDYSLTKDLITQLDPVCIKIQTEYSVVKKIDVMADDIAVLAHEYSSSKIAPNIDQLLGH